MHDISYKPNAGKATSIPAFDFFLFFFYSCKYNLQDLFLPILKYK